MAQIITDEDFRLAASVYLPANNIVGATVDASARKIFDAQNIDITPSQAVLEAALDTALAQIAAEEALAAALAALETGRNYLQTLLDNPTPISLTVAVNNIKPVIDGNVFLTQWMTRYLSVYGTATTLATNMNPTTDALRARYILALSDIIAIRKPVS